ncbi:hypothetical protein THICB3160014 [Thiomonas sp. CB3]|nr:hypothetical protein THICB3160014 [Thiomonas sp. CB3]
MGMLYLRTNPSASVNPQDAAGQELDATIPGKLDDPPGWHFHAACDLVVVLSRRTARTSA